MDFRILGPLEVVEDGRRLPLGGRKQRALLAMLLLHANEVVASERLIDAVWGEQAPETVAKVLQVLVSQLRKVLESAGAGASRLLVTRAPGYMVEVETGQLDLHRFELDLASGRRALAGGDPARAAEVLRDALSLWRGEPLADFGYEEFAQAEIHRLAELRLEALEQRVEADLELGSHAALIGELESFVAAHPLREHLCAQLMLALYRSGRQAQALEGFRAARAVLLELGIDPSPELQRLERSILRQDASLDWVAPCVVYSTNAGSAAGTFVGRGRELAELLAGLDDALAGRGRVMLLCGEPGIGKTRLAEELADRARARDALVLVGRCWEAGGAPAYWPWVQSLREHVRRSEPTLLRAQLGRGSQDVAQILPELRDVLPDLPAPASPDLEGARFRLFDAVTGFLERIAAERPLVLVLDDLHAADEPSLLLFQFVARTLSHSRLLVLGAYRDVDPTVQDRLARVLAELVREPVTHRIELRGLSEEDIGRYVSLTTDLVPEPALVAELHAESEGNPLFVGEMTRLIAGGAVEGGLEFARLGVPQGARDVIGNRLRRLSKETLRVLTVAAVVGRDFRLSTVARLTGWSELELLDLLDEAMGARVVDEVPAVPGMLRFAHVLIRDSLYGDLTPARRLRLHAQVGEALEAQYADDLDAHLAELANHFAAAAPVGGVEKAIDYACRAGDRAGNLLAFEEAARLYRVALRHAEAAASGGRRRRCELLVRLGEVEARAGDITIANGCFEQAAQLAADIGATDLLAQAALGNGGRFVFSRGVSDGPVVTLLERAAAALGDEESALRVRVLARLACALRFQPSPDLRDALSAEALAIARRLEDPATLAYAVSARLSATMEPDDLDDRWALATELTEAEDKERAFEGHEQRTIVLLARGDLVGLRGELAALARLADELRQPSQLIWVAGAGATLAILEGRFAEAEQLVQRARTAGAGLSYDTLMYMRLLQFALRRELGQLDESVSDLEQAAEDDPTRPLFRCALALAHLELDNTGPGRGMFAELAADDFALVPVNNDWLLSAALLAETAARAEDADAAAILYDRLEPYGSLNVDTVELSTGSVARYLGLLASTFGDLDASDAHFADAVSMNERMGAYPWLAHAQDDYSVLLARRDGPGDRERARELAASALATYRRLTMERYAAAIIDRAGSSG